MPRRVLRRLALFALAAPAALMPGCSSELTTGPRIVSIVPVDGLGQSGIVGALLSEPLIVQAVDQNGDPVAGAIISWTIISGGGQVTPSQSTTESDGLAEATLRLGSVIGTQSVRAELSGATPVIFSATASAAPASQIVVAAGDNQVAPVRATLPVDIAVKVTDAFNNAKAGVTVVFNVTLGGGSLSSPTAASDADGIASVTWTLGGVSGVQTVTATVAGVPPVSFNATATSAPAAKITIVGGNNQSAPPGSQLPDSLVVRVFDQFDNPVSNVTVTWTPVGDAGQVSPASSSTDANGRAASSWTLGATGGPKTVNVTINGLAPVGFSAAGTIVFASISAGGHTCALDEGGVVYCWGFNGDGQLGLGQAAAGSGPVFSVPQPTALAGALTFSSVDAGPFHSCAPTRSFNPFCWGKNVDGRVGDDSRVERPSPTHLFGPQVFVKMDAGGTHSCGLTPGGRAFCWGSNTEGQLGQGGPFNFPSFEDTAVVVTLPVTYRDVAAGGLHSCAVTATGGPVCWGNNASGQLGDGTNTNMTLPTAVMTVMSFTAITAGGAHTCAIDIGGSAWCWGNNASGQLGNGGIASSNTPVPVGGGLTFASLSAGENHTCGLTTGGLAFCWGLNSSGQLGNGALGQATSPVPVGGGFNFSVVSAGITHSCGVTTGRVAYCWGDNQFGQLGDGTMVDQSLPMKVTFQP